MAAELLRIDMADGAAVDFRQPCRLDQQQIRYDTRCYFNVRSKADISRLNLPHADDN